MQFGRQLYLGTCLKVERQHVLATSRFALTNQEHPVPVETLLQNQLRGIHARQGAVKPRILVQAVIAIRDCFGR